MASEPAEVWWEDSDEEHPYDLSKFRILIVVGHDFDYLEATVIREHWQSWGAHVDVAGTTPEVVGHVLRPTEEGWDNSEKRTLEADVLLAEVDLAGYHALFFPGGKGPENLLQRHGENVKTLVKTAHAQGKLVAGICHGPQVLAAAGVLSGRKATGFPDIAQEIGQAGGEYVMAVTVSDGNVLTGNWPYFESFAVALAERLLCPGGGGPSEKTPFAVNPTLRTIRERRNVAAFAQRGVEPELITTLLKAATWAHSANNEQPWRFVVVREKGVRARLHEALLARTKALYGSRGLPPEQIEAYWGTVFSAPVHIVLFTVPSSDRPDLHPAAVQHTWELQGTTMAGQNIVLAAKAMGLGCRWVGGVLLIEEEARKAVAAPEDARVVAMIAVGYPAFDPLPPVRKPLSAVAFTDRWGKP